MKIILSHDIDHLNGLEHWRDLYWPGVWFRGAIALFERKVSAKTYFERAIPWQRLERIKEVLELDQSVGARPTFFVGMSNGLRLSYSQKAIQSHIDFLMARNIPVGLHGMAYDEFESMDAEHKFYYRLTEKKPVGIRNHYLRCSDNTLNFMSKIGYCFDSTTYNMQPPFQVDEMWEFPITLMDVNLGVDTSLDEKKEKSISKYEEAINTNLPYFVLNFHDNYFSAAYPSMKTWYAWFIRFLAQQHTFITFEDAIQELNG